MCFDFWRHSLEAAALSQGRCRAPGLCDVHSGLVFGGGPCAGELLYTVSGFSVGRVIVPRALQAVRVHGTVLRTANYGHSIVLQIWAPGLISISISISKS